MYRKDESALSTKGKSEKNYNKSSKHFLYY